MESCGGKIEEEENSIEIVEENNGKSENSLEIKQLVQYFMNFQTL